MLNLTLNNWLVILSALVSAIGFYHYLRDTLSGKSKPNRVTWFMWAIALIIGSCAAMASNAGIWNTLPVFLTGFFSIHNFVSLFSKH